MKEIYLKYNDHELFDTSFLPEHFHFIITHMDAFKHMWNEQTKPFWCKYLTMYRHYCYTVGTVRNMHQELNPKNLTLNCISVLADQIFIVLYNEFVDCRYGTAKDLIKHIKMLIINRDLVIGCRSNSIQNNPFYMAETRDVFRKLIGCCRSYPPTLKEIFLHCLAYPIYGVFGASIYHLLKRWLCANELSTTEDKYLQNCWECPPELLHNDSFVPSPYHRHMVTKSGDQVDQLLFHGCFGLFSSHRISPDEGHIVLKDSEELEFPSSQVFETFIEFISTREWIPNEKYNCKDMHWEFNEYLKDKVDDFEDEELRRAVILKMAEKKFQEEKEDENKKLRLDDKSHEKKCNKPNDKNSRKPKNNIKNSTSSTNIPNSPGKPQSSISSSLSKPVSVDNTVKKDIQENKSNLKETANTTMVSKGTSTSSGNLNAQKSFSGDSAIKEALKEHGSLCENGKDCYVCVSAKTTNCPSPVGKKSKKKKKSKCSETEKPTQTQCVHKVEAVTQTDAKFPPMCSTSKRDVSVGNETASKVGNNVKTKNDFHEKPKGNIQEGNKSKPTLQSTNITKQDKVTNMKQDAITNKKQDTVTNKKQDTVTIQKQDTVTNKKQDTLTIKKQDTGTNKKQDKVKIVNKDGTASSNPGKESPTTSRGSSADLEKIKKNIDTIQQTVQEKNELSLDGFRLMVETGSLLMSGKSKADDSKQILQSCSQCRKNEEKPKCFKKCARCKTENVKWVRYYCSRECQAENWIQCHQEEHEKNLLVKK